MSMECTDTEIHRFIKAYIQSRGGKITAQSSETFTVTYPDEASSRVYTYQPAVSREKKALLIMPGSPAFQQILKECLESGVLCQISLKPKENYEAVLRRHLKDAPFACQDCDRINAGEEVIGVCEKTQPCYHRINNAKIASVNVIKAEPVRFYQFFYSAAFQNRLRAKNEETITVLLDEKGTVVSGGFDLDGILKNDATEVQDFDGRLKAATFDTLKTAADEKLNSILQEKLILFDLPLCKSKKSKLNSFDKRLRRERREQVISKKHDFDYQKWQVNYEALLRREEESYITSIAVKFINLLVINTTKVRFQVNLDNNSAIDTSIILGVNHELEITCPICHKTFSEGYATQDSLYVCGGCIKQSIDTKKFYSKKARLTLDETLNEYIEPDSGFVCSVCGKRHSKLLEFKCSHDNSSVCIYHYEHCDVCGKIFSKLNLSYTDEFKRKLCPKHAGKDKLEAP